MRLQSLQAGMTVGIGWPLVGRVSKGLALPRISSDTEVSRDAVETTAQHVGIKVGGTLLLDFCARPVERHEQILRARGNGIAVSPAPQEVDNGGFPIDQGPVNVKSHGVEIRKAQRHGSLRVYAIAKLSIIAYR